MNTKTRNKPVRPQKKFSKFKNNSENVRTAISQNFRKTSQRIKAKTNESRENFKHFVDHSKENFKKTMVQTHTLFQKRLGVIFWSFLAILFIGVFFSLRFFEGLIESYIETYGYVAIFVISMFTDFLAQPVGPDVPLVIAYISGVFNPWFILIAVILGSYAAFTCSYYVGKGIGSAGMQSILGRKRYEKIMERPRYGKWFLFLGALTPIPFIPYLAGMMHLTFRQCLYLVIIPRSIRFTIVLLLSMYIGSVVHNLILL